MLVKVRDTGVGIAAELLPYVFQLFAQGALGIGLTLVKTLAEMHGGTVTAHSAGAGQGSELTLELPVVSGEFAPRAEAIEKSEPKSGNAEAAQRRGVKVYFYLFDLLYLDGCDLRNAPLVLRKQLLKHDFQYAGPLRYSKHREREGEAYYREACRKGLEGVIAKRASSTYVSARSRDWLKFKCTVGQELVIGGYTDPQGARVGFGALLLGYYEDGNLVYAGKVGTGFDTGVLTQLGRKLAALQVERSPFSGEAGARRGVHWVGPKLVAQVNFTEWTHDGKLRHPRFLGLRKDKKAREIVRERPQ